MSECEANAPPQPGASLPQGEVCNMSCMVMYYVCGGWKDSWLVIILGMGSTSVINPESGLICVIVGDILISLPVMPIKPL